MCSSFNSCPIKGYSFPLKLYEVITHEDKSLIDFLPDGCGFKVKDTPAFRDIILPKYFRTNKIPSFTKQLNLYGFKRVNDGINLGAYIHPDFIRGRKDLAMSISKICRESHDVSMDSSSGDDQSYCELSSLEKKMSSVLAQISSSAIAHHSRIFKWSSSSSKIALNFINSEQFVGERYVGQFDSEDEATAAVEAILSGGDHVWTIEQEHHAVFKKLPDKAAFRLYFRDGEKLVEPIELGIVFCRRQGHVLIQRILASIDMMESIRLIRHELGESSSYCAEKASTSQQQFDNTIGESYCVASEESQSKKKVKGGEFCIDSPL